MKELTHAAGGFAAWRQGFMGKRPRRFFRLVRLSNRRPLRGLPAMSA
jgi:hypothetical protein